MIFILTCISIWFVISILWVLLFLGHKSVDYELKWYDKTIAFPFVAIFYLVEKYDKK